MPTCCPYCGVVTGTGGTVEWQGLRIDWEPVAVFWHGREVPRLGPAPTRFLHVLVAAQGRAVRKGLFDTMIGMDAGVNTRASQFTQLRRWLEASGLPFMIPLAGVGQGYRLVADAVRLAA